MKDKYETYLKIISQNLQKFFEQQKPYIFCKKGCAICCETGLYPFSKLEFQYAMLGYEALTDEEKREIQAKIKQIKKAKKKSNDKEFMHECPFLLGKRCSIYEHRGIICRSYGLMYMAKNKQGDEICKLPCCVHKDLNYSNVYDEKRKKISLEKYTQLGVGVEPLAYNVGLDFLLNNKTTKELHLDFGEQKALIDWFE